MATRPNIIVSSTIFDQTELILIQPVQRRAYSVVVSRDAYSPRPQVVSSVLYSTLLRGSYLPSRPTGGVLKRAVTDPND